MTDSEKQKLDEMIDGHWNYTFGLIKLFLKLLEYVYKQAFKHGYKHGLTDKKNG